MKAAREWRDAHHPTATREHMPFAGHRTQKQVREDEEREALVEKLERETRSGS